MNAGTAARLLDLNREFYEKFGASFSATRRRLQPGVQRVLETLSGDESVLDLGCGNGELARALASRGHRGSYTGVDSSEPLLRDARASSLPFAHEFFQADLTSGTWLLGSGKWSLIAAFAVLHHIPGEELRRKIVHQAAARLEDGGRLALSNWQFLNSPRLKQRVQDWGTIGLNQADVDACDYLLDWRSGGTGLRYVHQFTEEELGRLAESAGLRVLSSYYSDGTEGNLSLYQTWG